MGQQQKGREKNITLDDKIGIGNFEPDPRFFQKTMSWQIKEEKDFSEEFQEIFAVFTIYQRKKDKITLILPRPVSILRLVFGVGLILILVFFGFDSWLFRHGILSLCRSDYCPSLCIIQCPKQKNKMLDELRLEYEDKLVCPKCKSRLINHSLTYWRGKQQCPQPDVMPSITNKQLFFNHIVYRLQSSLSNILGQKQARNFSVLSYMHDLNEK